MASASFFTRVAAALRARLLGQIATASTHLSVEASLDAVALKIATAATADQLAVAHVVAEAPTDGAATARLLLFPMGNVTTRDGRRYRLDDLAHAQAVIDASVAYAGNRDIPCDYDHQLVYAVGKAGGGQAPAAGWIKPASLKADAQGIWGEVEWTATAATRLAGREYRYTSPSFTHDQAGRITSIRFLSLVNDNAIDELPAVAATQEQPVDLSKIAAALGLAATASADEIAAAIAKLTMPAAGLAACAAALGLGADASADQIATAATALKAAADKPDPAKFVPVAVLQETNDRLAVLETERREKLVTAATEAGKLTPAQRPWALDYVTKDEAGFNAFIAGQPAIMAPGATTPDPLATTASQHGLTAAELEVARAMGITPEAMAAAKSN